MQIREVYWVIGLLGYWFVGLWVIGLLSYWGGEKEEEEQEEEELDC